MATRPKTGASRFCAPTDQGEVGRVPITARARMHRRILLRRILLFLPLRAFKSRFAPCLQFDEALLQHPQVQA